MKDEKTPIQKYYAGKTIFITGGSGFMGKVLIEKLLYSCSDLKEILILVRPKKGKSPESRIEDMFKIPVNINIFGFRKYSNVICHKVNNIYNLIMIHHGDR